MSTASHDERLVHMSVATSTPTPTDTPTPTPTSAPTPTPTSIGTLSISLVAGWNWVSVNLVAEDMSFSNVISTGNFSQEDMIKSGSAYGSFYPHWGWFGTLMAFDVSQGFSFRVRLAQTLTLTGVPVPIPSVLPILAGWNWIPTHFQASESLDKFHFAEAMTGDMLKSQTAYNIYYADYGWFGTLQQLEPGVGYKLKASQAGTIQFIV